MLIIAAVFLVFFIGTFLTTITSVALRSLGEVRFLQILQKKPRYSFLKKKKFSFISLASSLNETISKLFTYSLASYLLIKIPFLTPITKIVIAFLFVFLFLLVGNVLPKFWVKKQGEKALLFSLPVSIFFFYLGYPFTFPFLKWATPLAESSPLEKTIIQIIQASNVNDNLSASDKKLIESVIKFKERIIREVMIPRVNLFSLSVNTKIREAAKLLLEKGYSRVPVYQKTVDNIMGVLMFKDILKIYMDCDAGIKTPDFLDSPIQTLIKKPFYTPETKKGSQLLQEFRTKLMHMAIVVDEYGGTEGIVTIEDILEEIVGEIADEYDQKEPSLYTPDPQGKGWILDARINISEIEELFNIDLLQEGEYDTLGGYIFHKIGAIPKKGLIIPYENFSLEILSVTERHIEKVRLTLHPSA